jgi:PAS domain S-box-containing protein
MILQIINSGLICNNVKKTINISCDLSMQDQTDELARIRTILSENPKGITIEDIAKKLPLNRTSTAKYLNTLQISGQAEMRTFGRAKVYTLSQRIPFSQMLNLSSDLLLVVDEDLIIKQVNEPFIRVFGHSTDALIGASIGKSGLLPELSEKYLSQIRDALTGTEHITTDRFEIRGHEYFFKIKLTPIVFDQGGQGLAVILEDITHLKKYQLHLEQLVYERTKELTLANEQLIREIDERLKYQQALEQSEKKYRELVENANSIILRVNEQGSISFFNEFAEKFFGFSQDEIIGKKIVDTIITTSDGAVKGTEESVQKFLNPSEYLAFNELKCFKKNGEPVWIAWNNKAVIDPGGRVQEYLIVGTDITERKQVENALYQVNTKLNLVSSVARHDVLNKLTVISSTLSFLKESITDPHLKHLLDLAETATNAITRQMEFTRDYKDMGIEKAYWQDVDETIHKALSINFGKEIQFDLRLNGLELFADPWLKKVFSNLTDVMIRSELRTNTIMGFYKESEDGIELFFEGDGNGIPDDKKEKIFEHGFGDANGFGLFLAREILAITGITIREKGEPGKSLRFVIHAPKRAYRFKERLH